jgi:hypothetical protein
MLNRRARITFVMLVLTAAAGAARAKEADQTPAPQDAKTAAQAAAGREPENRATQATQAPAANAGGAMVFMDPATGKIVQPTEAQIGSLAPSPQAGPKAKAPVIMIEGPGGAVGIVLTPESFSYSVATRTADGKVAMDCVTGDQAAERMVAGESSNLKATPKAKGPPDEKK